MSFLARGWWVGLFCILSGVAWAGTLPTLPPSKDLDEDVITKPATKPAAKPSPEPAPEVPAEASQPSEEEAPRFRQIGASASLNIPHPLFVDGEYRFNSKFSAALGGGGLPLNLNVNNIQTKLSIWGIDVRGRYHPFDGALFLGAALGYQKFNGSGTDTFQYSSPSFSGSLSTTISASISSLYFTPHAGWLWVWDCGFTLGVEGGFQIPFGASTDIGVTTSDARVNQALQILANDPHYQNLLTAVKKVGDQLGSLTLPYVTLIRLGYFF